MAYIVREEDGTSKLTLEEGGGSLLREEPDVFATVTANTPSLSVEVDFTNDPSNPTRVWTDITTYVRELSYTRGGRNSELQRTEPGTLTAALDNRDGRFDPTYTSSPYYPGVKRTRWIRVRAQWAGVTYARWAGVVDVWQNTWPASGRDAVCMVSATDTFKVLNLFDLYNLSYGAQLTGARVAAVLTSAGVAAGTVDAGQTTVVASGTFALGSSALSHLLAIEETESGLVFADADGTIVFQDRKWRGLNAATSSGTIGDLAGEIPYRTGTLDSDDADLWNTVTVTPSGGTPITVTDATSVAAHFARQLNISMLSSSTDDANGLAGYLKTRYAEGAPRVPSVDLIGAAATTFWPTILTANNSSRFVWHRRPENAARTITLNVYVERISETIIPGTDWRVSWQLSPTDDTVYWLAGDSVLSLAGTTTKAGY